MYVYVHTLENVSQIFKALVDKKNVSDKEVSQQLDQLNN